MTLHVPTSPSHFTFLHLPSPSFGSFGPRGFLLCSGYFGYSLYDDCVYDEAFGTAIQNLIAPPAFLGVSTALQHSEARKRRMSEKKKMEEGRFCRGVGVGVGVGVGSMATAVCVLVCVCSF